MSVGIVNLDSKIEKLTKYLNDILTRSMNEVWKKERYEGVTDSNNLLRAYSIYVYLILLELKILDNYCDNEYESMNYNKAIDFYACVGISLSSASEAFELTDVKECCNKYDRDLILKYYELPSEINGDIIRDKLLSDGSNVYRTELQLTYFEA